MSNARNNVVRTLGTKSIFESALPVLSTSCNWNQGDLLSFDATNKILNAVTGSGSSANLCGIAGQTIIAGVVPSPYLGTQVDASVGLSDLAGPSYGNVYSMVLKSGDSFTPGALVYATTDPQTVTVTSAGSAVGIFNGRAVTPAVTGTFGDVLIGSQYNQNGLSF